MWSGTIADIPEGWVLCDGDNETPDLRDKFVVGARQDDGGVAKTNVKGTLDISGGEPEHTLTIAEIPPHSHSYLYPKSLQAGGGGGVWASNGGSMTGTGSAGEGKPHENCPPFYALAFIMKELPE